ncbi:unnamed protein product [Lampetra fluviatilis]
MEHLMETLRGAVPTRKGRPRIGGRSRAPDPVWSPPSFRKSLRRGCTPLASGRDRCRGTKGATGVEKETTAGTPEDGATTPEASHEGRASPKDPAALPRGGSPGEVLQSTRDGDRHLGGLCDATVAKPLCRRRTRDAHPTERPGRRCSSHLEPRGKVTWPTCFHPGALLVGNLHGVLGPGN